MVAPISPPAKQLNIWTEVFSFTFPHCIENKLIQNTMMETKCCLFLEEYLVLYFGC